MTTDEQRDRAAAAGKGEAAQEGGRRSARAERSYPVDELPPELQILADVALRVAEERRAARSAVNDPREPA